jgi:TetR/AcrR family transcriptional regulator, regulator of autoinduction and epiphytic fitness
VIDPRVERSRLVIRRAALEELAEVGYGAFAIESVAHRASVSRSTIYRHWPDKLTLIADAFETFHEHLVPSVETGTPRERVERLVQHVAEIVVDSLFSVCIPALIEGAERDALVREFHHQYSAERREELVAIISEGIANGDWPRHTNPQLAAQALLGVIFYRRLMTGEPFDPSQTHQLVDTILGQASV